LVKLEIAPTIIFPYLGVGAIKLGKLHFRHRLIGKLICLRPLSCLGGGSFSPEWFNIDRVFVLGKHIVKRVFLRSIITLIIIIIIDGLILKSTHGQLCHHCPISLLLLSDHVLFSRIIIHC
jgi:hypothetical protein